MSEPHGHWVYDDQHGQVWCDAPDCEPLADAIYADPDDEHPVYSDMEDG